MAELYLSLEEIVLSSHNLHIICIDSYSVHNDIVNKNMDILSNDMLVYNIIMTHAKCGICHQHLNRK